MSNTLKHVLLPSASWERDEGFREVLTVAAAKGIQVASVLGITAVVLFIAIKTIVVGDSVGWAYGDDVVVLWDKVLLVALCIFALFFARRGGLTALRVAATVLVLTAAFASLSDDIAGGDTGFSQGYVGFIYLLAVLAVPYRPAHTFGLGVGLSLLLYGAVEVLPQILGLPDVRHVDAHYTYLASMTVVLSGMSGYVYSVRYGQYVDRRHAEELREQVQALEAAKSRFFVNLSHELRTPLTLLSGPLEDVEAGRYGEVSPRLRLRVREMRAQAAQLGDLVDQLLDLSTLEDGAMPIRAREYDFGVLVERYAAVFHSAMERKGISLRVHVPSTPVHVWCDAETMERVLSNLLSNALKHTPAGGTIRVQLRKEETGAGHAAVLSVRDSGTGIEPSLLASVFDRFSGSDTEGAVQASTGIGLALVKEIVLRHGGSVDVTSEPGFGAHFIVRLPLGKDHLAPEDILPAVRSEPAAASSRAALERVDGHVALDAEPPEHPPETPLVLIVEDNPAVRTYLRDILLTRYRVEEAEDGEEGFERMRAHPPALVLSDVMMPGGGGFELCRRIRADDRLAAVPVVLLTARAEDESRREGLASGADAYLTKPFSSDELLLIAENLIEVRRMLGERTKLPSWMASDAPALPSREAEFLGRVQQVIADHLGDPDFGVDWLADEVGLSTRQMQRRLKETTQLTAAGLIKTMRFERAAQLLAGSDLQVQEVADAVGYRDVGYFSKVFRQIHGMAPSAYSAREHKEEAAGASDRPSESSVGSTS